MNIEEYIASGTLEAYLLGAASDQERREVECLSSIYPEIKQELDQLAAALEGYALTYSKEPPFELREKIMQQISFDKVATTNAQPDAKVVPMPDSRPIYNLTWIAAASVGLILLVFSFFLINQLRENQQVVSTLRTTNSMLQQEVQSLKDRQNTTEQSLALLKQPGTKIIPLQGNEKAPEGKMMIYWNATSGQVALDITSLPKLPDNQQYQLWTLKAGKPSNAGVFDPVLGIHMMPKQPGGPVDAFAITIEQRGGSSAPHLDALVAMTQV